MLAILFVFFEKKNKERRRKEEKGEEEFIGDDRDQKNHPKLLRGTF